MTTCGIMYMLPCLAAASGWTAASAQIVQWCASAGMVVLCLSFVLCLIRLLRGPTMADRGMALDAIGIQLVGIIILLTIQTGNLIFVDGILIVTLLAFAGTIAVAQFIARPYMRRAGEPHVDAPSAPEEQS